ncbi:MAG: LCP family protein [Anaerolineae bacterium]|nr:LCP family protein [Anaerolineae bacterium]
MSRSDFIVGGSGMRERIQRQGQDIDAGAKPWYLNPNTWVGVVIGAAVIGTMLIIALTMLLVLQSRTATEQAMLAATQTPGSVAFNAPPPGGMGSASGPVIEPWSGTERFTVLVMGIDRRPGETGTGYRSDTMILVSIDPAAQSVGMLSIPRDLYVVIPGYADRHRVNEALVLGELQRLGYGPQLAMETVQLNFGIRVHDYLVVDFTAFTRIIDEMGGITLDIPYAIYDPLYPDQNFGYDPFYIDAGVQHLDGTTALKYARTRHSDNDFKRADRQQQVIYAIRDKILDAGMWPHLLGQAPTIWDEISKGVHTQMDFMTMLQIALYLKDIPRENIRSGVVDYNYSSDYLTPKGEQVLIPNQSALATLMTQVFGSTYNR